MAGWYAYTRCAVTERFSAAERHLLTLSVLLKANIKENICQWRTQQAICKEHVKAHMLSGARNTLSTNTGEILGSLLRYPVQQHCMPYILSAL